MTIEYFLKNLYAWCNLNSFSISMAVGFVLPVAGTVMARIFKGGRTDRDGKFIASGLLAVSVIILLVEMCGIVIARVFFDANIVKANFALIVSPPIGMILTFLGIRSVFPLNQLASYRTMIDFGILIAVSGSFLWFLSKFRGWSIWFIGGIFQLIILLAMGVWIIRRLYKRAMTRKIL